VALVPDLARAAATTPPSPPGTPPSASGGGRGVGWGGGRRLLGLAASSVRSAASSPRGRLRTILRLALAAAAALVAAEAIAARGRQRADATSEWGRYADRPALRGLALTMLGARAAPYAILPGIIEGVAGLRRGRSLADGDGGRRYESTARHRLRRRGGEIVADGLLRLGPLYVKIGQILSCRRGLLPPEWTRAMERLQDRVPAKSGREAWDLAYEACPGGKTNFHRTFDDFDDVPLAAASLGQVHRARLRSTGERVAIKIQRPRLRDIYDKDLAMMGKIARMVDNFGGKAGRVGGVEQSWEGIFRDAGAILYREIDYRDEADNAARFAADFGVGVGGEAVDCAARGLDGRGLPSAAGWMRTPHTYRELSSEKFLVMEYVPR
jgi:hypothetical protein